MTSRKLIFMKHCIKFLFEESSRLKFWLVILFKITWQKVINLELFSTILNMLISPKSRTKQRFSDSIMSTLTMMLLIPMQLKPEREMLTESPAD